MRSTILTLAALLMVLTSPAELRAQALESTEPFKVGTFENRRSGDRSARTAGHLDRRHRRGEQGAGAGSDLPRIGQPADMLELIGQYEYGIKFRLYEIVNDLVAENRLTGSTRADYVHDLEDVGILPPILYPGKIMNAAVNFYTHACEGCTEEELQAQTRERQENRGVPYLFLKPARGAVIGTGDDIVLPYGRERIDWEVELGTVIGRAGKYISAPRAEDHVFGYMVSIDVSDRGGRPAGGFSSGQDWFVSKGHDTFAPQGPWIVPKEFYGDPWSGCTSCSRSTGLPSRKRGPET